MGNSLRYQNFDLHLAGGAGRIHRGGAGVACRTDPSGADDVRSRCAVESLPPTLRAELSPISAGPCGVPRSVADGRGAVARQPSRDQWSRRVASAIDHRSAGTGQPAVGTALRWTLGRFVALDGITPVVRFIRLPFAAAAWPQDRPLRLHFTGSSPRACPRWMCPVKRRTWKRRWREVSAGGRIKLIPLSTGATLTALLAGLREGVDIWHFAGHGDRNGLFFGDRQGGAAAAEAGTLGQLLPGEGLQLAVINACRAGSSGGTRRRWPARWCGPTSRPWWRCRAR